MKNVTISLDEELARRARIEAAKRDMSLSKYIAELLRQQLCRDEEYQAARQRFQNRSLKPMRDPVVPLPSRDEMHDRPGLR